MSMARNWRLAFGGVELHAEPYYAEKIDGLIGLPEVKTQDRHRLVRDGLVPGRDRMAGRTVTVVLEVVEWAEEAFAAAVSALEAAFTSDVSEQPLTFTIPGVAGGRPAILKARPRRFQLPIGDDYVDMVGKAAVELYATDPLLYAEEATTVVIGLARAAGGVGFPVRFPLGFGDTGNLGAVIARNDGTAPSSPLIRINGPVTNPTVTHQGTGRRITAELVLANGEWLEIDTFARTVMLNGQANRYSALSRAEWFNIDPGPNELRFSATAIGDTTAEVTYRSAWL